MACKNARTLWADKILRGAKDSAPSAADSLCLRKPYSGCVLGIDPSLRGTGLAVLDFDCGTPALRAQRTLRLGSKLTMPDCLGEIYKAVADFIEEWPVCHVALEQTIYVQNFQTAQILGAARGAGIAAASVMGCPVFEYPPLRVKQAVVGFGRASKPQVAGMVSRLLAVAETLPFDEADAAAVALCHAFTWKPE